MSEMDDLLGRLKAQQISKSPAMSVKQHHDPPKDVKAIESQQTTNSLLNLLNIRAQASPTPQRAISSFTLGSEGPSRALPVRQASANAVPTTGEPSNASQQYLLDLLTRGDTSVPKASSGNLMAPAAVQSERFSYINPFDQLHASSPLNQPATKPESSINEEDSSKQDATKDVKSVTETLMTVGQEVDTQVEQALTQAEQDTKVKDDVESNWSTAEDDTSQRVTVIDVYNFPMRPFVSLKLAMEPKPQAFRSAAWEKSMPVARMKKDFSHDDRVLVTASQAYIAYAVPPTDKKAASGLKLIQQDEGKNKHLWPQEGERFVSVQLPATDEQALLATGVNGTLYFAKLPSAEEEFDTAVLEAECLTIPAPASDEPAQPTDTPAVRTRAKLSSKHPTTCFAAARGRLIYLIAPDIARSHTNGGDIDTAAYIATHGCTINIGKACKDFCFSVDDTVLATLDKLGRLKLWDLRELIPAVEAGGPRTSVKDALYSLPQTAKTSPSSVTLLDKERAHTKKVALRYVLLGFQQNRTLQLWDLGLSKCVQELHLPDTIDGLETEESKGVCSVTYHPKTSMIVVGHPGRNSAFMIHLSAPKYDLTPLSQAAYLTALANKDLRTAPKPESTAIMSGVREVSFAKIGQLRSLEILKNPFPADPDADEVQFELYALHSKGLLAIPVTKQDLGWDAKSKITSPIDGQSCGMLTVTDLTESGEDAGRTASGSTVASSKPTNSPAPLTAKQAPEIAPTTEASKPPPPVFPKLTPVPKNPPVTSSSILSSTSVKPVDSPLAPQPAEVQQNGTKHDDITSHFDQLYKRLENDRRVGDATATARQDAVLRLVSSTLTDNVETSLQRIVASAIEQQVLPSIKSVVAQAVEHHCVEQVRSTLQTELATLVPSAVRDSLRDTDMHKDMMELSRNIERQIAAALAEVQSLKAHTVSQSVEQKTASANDLAKVMQGVEDSEARITTLLESVKQEQALFKEALSSMDTSKPLPRSEEAAKLSQLLDQGQWEQAMIGWLQSSKQAALFDELFVHTDPKSLQHVSSLIALSVSAAVTASLESNIVARLDWLTSVVANVNTGDQEIHDVAPKVMDVLTQRLQATYMQMSESQPTDQEVLRKLAATTRLIASTRRAFD